ncbi:hypothetical protein ACFXPY_12195 [Streptomyces sp. NPDC059153]|uniref:hypothetical protein n=1 Tax=Streptomyces sp. NPDC059153 TaxID=3346743 RepID=UPI00369EA43F
MLRHINGTALIIAALVATLGALGRPDRPPAPAPVPPVPVPAEPTGGMSFTSRPSTMPMP